MTDNQTIICVAIGAVTFAATVILSVERIANGYWPGGCPGHHRKRRTLHTSVFSVDGPGAARMTDTNECARCGAAYNVRRAETASEYAERTKLGEV